MGGSFKDIQKYRLSMFACRVLRCYQSEQTREKGMCVGDLKVTNSSNKDKMRYYYDALARNGIPSRILVLP